MRRALGLVGWIAACEPAPVDEVDPEPVCAAAPGVICTWIGLFGQGHFGAGGAHRLDSGLFLPIDGTFGPDGRFYFIDYNNHRIRVLEDDETVITIAGSGFLGGGPEGDALAFAWNHPTDLAFDPADDTRLFVAAWGNSRIGEIELAAGTARFICGTGTRGFGGDGGPATAAMLELPSSLAFLRDGAYLFMDQRNHLIRRVDAEGTITTYAGVVEMRAVDADADPATEPIEVTKGWPGYAGDGGPVSEARFYGHFGFADEPSSRITIAGDRLYVADTMNHLIRVIDLEAGTIERFAGAVSARAWDHDQWSATPEVVETRGWPGYGGDGGDRLDAAFNGPTDVEVDVDGSVFVADTSNHCVRKIDPTGIVTTVAGMCGQPGAEGDGGPATEAKLDRPSGIALAPNGDLVIADTANHVFRVVHRGE